MNKILFLSIWLLVASGACGQATDFRFELKEVGIAGFTGVQSFAWGEYNGLWLLVGGRHDGLHRRQPFASFDAAGKNQLLWVIDPATRQSWSAPLSSLTTSIAEQLSATNFEFYQRGNTLYIIGGYGYAASAADHVTFPYLCALEVPEIIAAIRQGEPFGQFIRQSAPDERLRVTGGYLIRLGEVYYLSGGQKFIGRYNPMGPAHGPGFVQEYTDQIRRFELLDNGLDLSVVFDSPWTDGQQLHRRDYNAVLQIYPDGRRGFTIFSGVFQHDVDLPWLNIVEVDSSGFYPNNSFNQLLNQYHTAHLPLYDAGANQMHTVFFGGIGRYYVDAATGLLVDDPNVPFVRTISRITRDATGQLDEVKVGDMPALLGSGAEFLPAPHSTLYDDGILLLDQLSGDSVLVGYVVGGIQSSAANIFLTNTGTESDASNKIYQVVLVKNDQVSAVPAPLLADAIVSAAPNPATGDVVITLNLPYKGPVSLQLFDSFGNKLLEMPEQTLEAGKHQFLLNLGYLPKGVYRAVMLHNRKPWAHVPLSRS